jgi:hypothetical protein
MIPAFGFGAELRNGKTDFEFHLNFDDDPHVAGVEGLLNAYVQSIQTVLLSGVYFLRLLIMPSWSC